MLRHFFVTLREILHQDLKLAKIRYITLVIIVHRAFRTEVQFAQL